VNRDSSVGSSVEAQNGITKEQATTLGLADEGRVNSLAEVIERAVKEANE